MTLRCLGGLSCFTSLDAQVEDARQMYAMVRQQLAAARLEALQVGRTLLPLAIGSLIVKFLCKGGNGESQRGTMTPLLGGLG